MQLRSISEQAIAGTGTLSCPAKTLGGVLISADGTNAATVKLRSDNSSGPVTFHLVTKSPIFVTGPFSNNGSVAVYYDISGTSALAQIFEWVE